MNPAPQVHAAEAGGSAAAAAERPVVLVAMHYFLPGWKAGGPIRSIANLAAELSDEFRFRVLALDRDLGETAPYPGVPVGEWRPERHWDVCHLPPRRVTPLGLRPVLAGAAFDLLYLNGFFSPFTVSALVLRRAGLLPRRPVLVAPRGELAPDALGLKRAKKSAYLLAGRALGLFRGLTWHASSPQEREEIARFGGRRIHVATNLPARSTVAAPDERRRPPKRRGELRVAFLSRISRKKNLHFALRVLRGVGRRVDFDVYGTLEDRAYIEECRRLAAELPPGVSCELKGPVPPDEIHSVLARYHAFLLPTLNENFGHVILEALGAGLPVVISDRTTWRGLRERGAGFDLPLADAEAFRDALRELADLDAPAWSARSRGAWTFARQFAEDPAVAEDSRRLLRAALAGGAAS